MYQIGLLLGGFNHSHNGHIELIKVGLEKTDSLDICIGLKPKNERLPYEIRAEALQAALEEENINDRVRILPKIKFHDLNILSYGLFVLGSDVFNRLNPNDHMYKENERERLSSFAYYVVMEREGVPIDPVALCYMGGKKRWTSFIQDQPFLQGWSE